MKKAFVINGKGSSGKDTMCNFVGKRYKVMNVSSITPIKEAAMILGWDGEKDEKSRKFLSDIKSASIDFNNYPNSYLVEKYIDFMNGDKEIFFAHIREPSQIVDFVESIGGDATTIKISRPESNRKFGNGSDDSVDDFQYDYEYINDKPINLAENEFISFFNTIIESV